jgi:glutaconate CoA-transferase subunit A
MPVNETDACSKVMQLDEAVSRFVNDGDMLYCAGWTQLEPHAAMHEVIRQRKRNLTLARSNVNIIFDQAVAAGVARKLIFSYAGIAGVGLLGPTREALESGSVEWEEYTHHQLLATLYAGASGQSFYPLPPGAATQLGRVNPKIRSVICPYTGARHDTVPALNPDVTLVHAQRADAEGNLQIWGVIGDIREAVFASRHVIATVEEIVDESVVRSDPNRTVIPAFAVSAVVKVPWGAYPSFAQGYYDRHNAAYLAWGSVCKQPGGVAAYLDEHVFGVRDHAEFMARLPAKTLLDIQVRPHYSYPVNFGRND